MNTETQLARRSNNAIASIRTSALIAQFALASAVALADQQPVAATRVPKVSLVGLHISTPEDARAAYERIKAVAERLCFFGRAGATPARRQGRECVYSPNGVGQGFVHARLEGLPLRAHPKSEPRSNRYP